MKIATPKTTPHRLSRNARFAMAEKSQARCRAAASLWFGLPATIFTARCRTNCPGRSLSWSATTTRSPSCKPPRISEKSRVRYPTLTVRLCTIPCFTTRPDRPAERARRDEEAFSCWPVMMFISPVMPAIRLSGGFSISRTHGVTLRFRIGGGLNRGHLGGELPGADRRKPAGSLSSRPSLRRRLLRSLRRGHNSCAKKR